MNRDEILYDMVKDINERVRAIELKLNSIEERIRWRTAMVGAVAGFLPSAAVAIYFLLK